jgi:hypothetical protein
MQKNKVAKEKKGLAIGVQSSTGIVKKPTKSPVVVLEKEVAVVDTSVEGLIMRAIDKGTPVDTMERILAMRKDLKEERAREEFFKGMANFQNDCPIIQKTKKVLAKDKKSVRYQYAPIDAIIDQTKTFIQKHGFSYSANAVVEDGWVTAVVIVTHELGHSEKSEFKVPVDKDSYMSAPQQFAAALTFAKRYAFCNAFGILTGDEDTDAVQDEEQPKNNYSKPAYQKPTEEKIINGAVVPEKMTAEQKGDIEKMLEILKKDVAWLEKVGKVKFDIYTKAQADGIIAQLIPLVNKQAPASTEDKDGVKDAEIC